MRLKHKLFAAIATAVFMSSPVRAADFQFYGTAALSTFWEKSDLEDQTRYVQALNPGANIGAEVKVTDAVSGGFEYGTEEGRARIVSLVGEWHFGPGSIRVGQAETPAYQGISGQVWDDDRALDGVGEFNPGELAQIRLALGRFELAAVAPDVQVTTTAGLDDSLSAVRMPTVHVRYSLSQDGLAAGLAGAYANFDYKDQDVTSYAVLASAATTFARYRLAAQGWFGQNVGNIAPQDTMGSGEDGFAIFQGDRIHDVDAWGVALVVQVVLTDRFSLEAGFGHVRLDFGDASLYQDKYDKVQSYYLNLPITLTQGAEIVPEIGVVDYHEAGQDKVTYGGAKWQVEF